METELALGSMIESRKEEQQMKTMNAYSYGDYSSDNYGVHCMTMRDEYGNQFWFSYETLVAFRCKGEFHIRKNIWGSTTGKHLNWIDPDKSIGESSDEFEANYHRLMS